MLKKQPTHLFQSKLARSLALLAPLGLIASTGSASAEDFSLGVNVTVKNIADSSIYTIPPKLASASSIGTQSVDSAGIIVEGPFDINGESWWNIDYESGVDGWTNASSLSATSLPQGKPLNIHSMVSLTPEVISWPLSKAYPGVEYNIRLGVVGGKYPYSFTLAQAPSGMSIHPKTGEISWKPSTSSEGQSYQIKVDVYDSLQQMTSQEYTLQVTKAGFHFVSPHGSDENGDGTINNPWQTISHGIDQGTLDDILYVRGGDYRELIKFDLGKTNKVIAYPSETPVVDVNFGGIMDTRDHYGVIDGLEIKNCQKWCFSASGNETDWIFRRNHMHHLYDIANKNVNSAFIFFWDGKANSYRFVIQDNKFRDLFDRGSGVNGDIHADYSGNAIVMFDVHHSLVEDNIAYNIDGMAFHDKAGSFKNTFRGNLAYNVKDVGISISNQEYSYGLDILYNKLTASFIGLRIGHQNTGLIGNILAHHNTIYGGMSHTNGTTPVGGENSIQIRDNIIDNIGSSRPTYFCCNTGDGGAWASDTVSRDYNFISTNSSIIAGMWGSNRFTMSTWNSFGQDINSIVGSPMLIGPAFRDYTPLPNSPVCGAASDGSDIGAVPCN
ncbi:Ig domain-containing protein [Hahella sp. HN01]|uniref:Ig domain-containing protein n=1 Tax=Hahella sp. HN01 TaxID=2847262 RepID=UPI001C1ED2BD|nr:Ig domain-containing protein [Hahella sp. HN01]MBU6951463.1 Ig domain-containing protein [Hahella sp. HN01]